MRKIVFIAGVLIASGALVAGIYAAPMKTIGGTPKNDVLRGTASADLLNGRGGNDKLYGKGGNDTLIGGGGNDLLVGGAGRDKLRCGPGRDTAIADATDTVGSDCETVKGLPPVNPPPAPPPPPTPPAPPPAPSGPTAKAGHYCGFTNQGKSICFDATTTSVANVATTSDVDCGNVGIPNLGLSFGGSTQIKPDLSFSFTYNGSLTTDAGSPLTNVTTSYSLTGKFDTAGNATGTLNLNRFSFDYQGTHYDCAAAGYGWQARLGA
jgi:Ca2+-binding RTX toxin-like protein